MSLGVLLNPLSTAGLVGYPSLTNEIFNIPTQILGAVAHQFQFWPICSQTISRTENFIEERNVQIVLVNPMVFSDFR